MMASALAAADKAEESAWERCCVSVRPESPCTARPALRHAFHATYCRELSISCCYVYGNYRHGPLRVTRFASFANSFRLLGHRRVSLRGVVQSEEAQETEGRENRRK